MVCCLPFEVKQCGHMVPASGTYMWTAHLNVTIPSSRDQAERFAASQLHLILTLNDRLVHQN